MDPLSQFLDGPRAAHAFALGVTMSGDWSIDVRDGAALTLVAITSGQAYLGNTLLRKGDVALARGPHPYTIAHAPGADPTIVIHPGQRCTTTNGEDLASSMSHGLRRWGNAAHGDTTMVIGTYERTGDIGRLATAALPPVAIVPGEQTDSAVIALLDRELSIDAVAQTALIDRLLDMLLITSVRAWLASNPPDRTASWLVSNDAVSSHAISLLHESPEHPWTVDELARRLSVSKATLAARFRGTVGTSPIAYLTEWRMSLASEYLAEPSATVASIGRRVGYESAFTFSTAFKRQFGQSPAHYRRLNYQPPQQPVLAGD
jgi:AraC-like DNA-binding protein